VLVLVTHVFASEDVTVYDVIAEPFANAASHDTNALPLSATARTFVGAKGAANGIDVKTNATEVPAAFVAVAEKVSAVPLVKPVNRQDVAVVVEHTVP